MEWGRGLLQPPHLSPDPHLRFARPSDDIRRILSDPACPAGSRHYLRSDRCVTPRPVLQILLTRGRPHCSEGRGPYSTHDRTPKAPGPPAAPATKSGCVIALACVGAISGRPAAALVTTSRPSSKKQLPNTARGGSGMSDVLTAELAAPTSWEQIRTEFRSRRCASWRSLFPAWTSTAWTDCWTRTATLRRPRRRWRPRWSGHSRPPVPYHPTGRPPAVVVVRGAESAPPHAVLCAHPRTVRRAVRRTGRRIERRAPRRPGYRAGHRTDRRTGERALDQSSARVPNHHEPRDVAVSAECVTRRVGRRVGRRGGRRTTVRFARRRAGRRGVVRARCRTDRRAVLRRDGMRATPLTEKSPCPERLRSSTVQALSRPRG